MGTNARNVGNKQNDLEIMVCKENYDFISITGAWWDNSHDWNINVRGIFCFRTSDLGRKVGGITLYIKYICLVPGPKGRRQKI